MVKANHGSIAPDEKSPHPHTLACQLGDFFALLCELPHRRRQQLDGKIVPPIVTEIEIDDAFDSRGFMNASLHDDKLSHTMMGVIGADDPIVRV